MLVVQTKKVGASAAFLDILGSDSSVGLIKSYRTQDSAECKELVARSSSYRADRKLQASILFARHARFQSSA